MCKVYTGYHGTSEIEHGLSACTVDIPLAKARGLSLHTGALAMLYLSLFQVIGYTKGRFSVIFSFASFLKERQLLKEGKKEVAL